MTFYDYLIETFGVNEPIFSSDIKYMGYSKPWLFKELSKLCDDGKLIRYERGIYYIPTKSRIGNSILSPEKVIERKYLRNGEDVFGFYSGLTLQNIIGLSTQSPNVIEICTNSEISKLRNVTVGWQKVILRRARTKITKENTGVLSFLELMNMISTKTWSDNDLTAIRKYIHKNNITRKDIATYAPVFPDKTMRNLIESGVIYDITQ